MKKAIDLRPYQEQPADDLVRILKAGQSEVLLAACPGFGKTEVTLEVLRRLLVAGHIRNALVLAHGMTMLRDNFKSRMLARCPELATKVAVAIHHEHRRIQGQFDLVVVDEAHDFYEVESGMADKTIQKVGAKQVLLLSATPAIFIRRDKKPDVVFSLQDLHAADGGKWMSDFRIDLAKCAYKLTARDWNKNGEVRKGLAYSTKHTEETLNELIASVGRRVDMANRKTLIACQSIVMAKQVHASLRSRHLRCLISTSDEQEASSLVDEFQTGCVPILVSVKRGGLGMDMPGLVNVVDMTFSKNPNRIFQMECRLARPLPGEEKTYVKVMPECFSGDHLAAYMAGVQQLACREFLTTWDGRGFLRSRVPLEDRSVARDKIKEQPPALQSGMMLFGQYFARLDGGRVFASAPLSGLIGIRDNGPLAIEINGRTQSAVSWDREVGNSIGTTGSRWRAGVRGVALLAKPAVHRPRFPPRKPYILQLTIAGKTQSFRAWSRETGIHIYTLRRRWKEGRRGSALLLPRWRRAAEGRER